MAIKYDELSQGTGTFSPGVYLAVVEKVETKVAKSSGKEFLALTSTLVNKDGEAKGKYWDNFYDSEHEIVQNKLRAFLDVLPIDFMSMGAFTFKDLAKMIQVGFTYCVELRAPNKEKNEMGPQVVVFDSDIYWPVGAHPDFENLSGTPAVPVEVVTSVNQDEVPFPLDENIANTEVTQKEEF